MGELVECMETRLSAGTYRVSGWFGRVVRISAVWMTSGWYLPGRMGGDMSWSLNFEVYDTKWPRLLCAEVLRPLDLVPLTDFTLQIGLDEGTPSALPCENGNR